MSKVLADTLQGRATGNEAPDFPKGATVTGVVTTNPIITVADTKTVTVGAAKTLVVDILNIDSLFDA